MNLRVALLAALLWCACTTPAAVEPERAVAPPAVDLTPAQDAARLATWLARTQGLVRLTQWDCPVNSRDRELFTEITPEEFLKAPREGRFLMSGYTAPNYFAERGESQRLFLSKRQDLSLQEQSVLMYYDLYCSTSFEQERPWSICDGAKYCDQRRRYGCCSFIIGWSVYLEDRWRCAECAEVPVKRTCSSYRAYDYLSQVVVGELPNTEHILGCQSILKPPCDASPSSCRQDGKLWLKGRTRYAGAKEIDGYKVTMWRFDVIRPSLDAP